VTSPNILRNYKNILPFGISIITEDGSEPFLIDDFSTGRVGFFVLNKEEVESFESQFYNS